MSFNHLRLGDLTAGIQEQSRKREEALHAFETTQREKDHSSDIEKTKLQGKIQEIAEEVSKKILMKEIKLREELQARYAQLEAVSLKSCYQNSGINMIAYMVMSCILCKHSRSCM